jgi:hypothetical protein
VSTTTTKDVLNNKIDLNLINHLNSVRINRSQSSYKKLNYINIIGTKKLTENDDFKFVAKNQNEILKSLLNLKEFEFEQTNFFSEYDNKDFFVINEPFIEQTIQEDIVPIQSNIFNLEKTKSNLKIITIPKLVQENSKIFPQDIDTSENELFDQRKLFSKK